MGRKRRNAVAAFVGAALLAASAAAAARRAHGACTEAPASDGEPRSIAVTEADPGMSIEDLRDAKRALRELEARLAEVREGGSISAVPPIDGPLLRVAAINRSLELVHANAVARSAQLLGDREIARSTRLAGTREVTRREWIDRHEKLLACAVEAVGRVDHRTALTIAGGVSLGAYQAGFLYYYTRFLQEYAARYDVTVEKRGSPLAIVTGASAGSINGFLSALTVCSSPIEEPEKSPFWMVWKNVGIGRLRAGPGTGRSLLSEDARDDVAKDLRALWTDRKSSPWSADECHVRLGFSATRLTARRVEVGSLASNYRLGEKFVFQLSRAKSVDARPPEFTEQKVPAYLDRRFYPRLGWADRPQLDDVVDLLLASSAFPLAFPPRALRYRLEDSGGSATDESALFIDGGVLDNQPVKLAQALVRWERAEGRQQEVRQIYVDTSAVAYGIRLPLPEGVAERGPVAQYARFLVDYASAAGQNEFLDAAEDLTFASSLAVPQRTLPVAGEHFLHFAAFAESAFRLNDFYVGMVDAYKFLHRTSPQFWMLARSKGEITAANSSTVDPVRVESLAYKCYRQRIAWAIPGGCEGVDPRLLQVLDVCGDLKTRILQGDRSDDLSDVFFDRLYAKGFVYSDLVDHRRLRAVEVRSELRGVFEEGLHAVASESDLVGGYVLKSVGRELGNLALVHKGPGFFWALGGTDRRGIDVTFGFPALGDRLRPSAAVQIFNLDISSIQYSPTSAAVLAPAAPGGRFIENKPAFGWNVALQPRLAYQLYAGAVVQVELGAGYTGSARFTSDWSNSFVYLRHGPVFAATVLGFERLYVDLSTVVYLDGAKIVSSAYQRDDIIPVVSRRPLDILFGIGWRIY